MADAAAASERSPLLVEQPRRASTLTPSPLIVSLAVFFLTILGVGGTLRFSPWPGGALRVDEPTSTEDASAGGCGGRAWNDYRFNDMFWNTGMLGRVVTRSLPGVRLRFGYPRTHDYDCHQVNLF
jgi:hypothetical protein